VRREIWSVKTATLTEAQAQRTHEVLAEVRRERGVYRKRFRA
jgi:hypothetical protein